MKAIYLAISLCCFGFFGFYYYCDRIKEPSVLLHGKHEIKVEEVSISNIHAPVWFTKTKNNTCCLLIKFSNEGYRNYKFTQPAALLILNKLILMGAGKYDSTNLMEELELNNISLNIQPDFDNIIVTCYSTASNFHKMIDILRIILSEAHLRDDKFKIVKQEVLQELAQVKCMPDSIAQEELQQLELTSKHPYNVSFDDLLRSCETCSMDDIINAYKKSFASKDAVITIAGNLEKEDVVLGIEKLSSTLKYKNNDFDCVAQTSVFAKHGHSNYHNTNDPQVVIRFSHPGVNSISKDFFAFDIGIGILGKRGFGSRLFNEIREKRGLSYGISCSIEETDLLVKVSGKASTRPENVEQLIDAIKEQFSELVSITQTELDDFKISLFSSDVLMSAKDIVYFLHKCRTRNIASENVNEYMQNYYDVTLDQLKSVMEKYISKDNLLFSVVGDVGGKK